MPNATVTASTDPLAAGMRAASPRTSVTRFARPRARVFSSPTRSIAPAKSTPTHARARRGARRSAAIARSAGAGAQVEHALAAASAAATESPFAATGDRCRRSGGGSGSRSGPRSRRTSPRCARATCRRQTETRWRRPWAMARRVHVTLPRCRCEGRRPPPIAIHYFGTCPVHAGRARARTRALRGSCRP